MASAAPTILAENLTFSLGGPPILTDVNLQLPAGARCLLVGANGAGKSTLLRILAGKRMVTKGRVEVLGFRAFYDNIPVGWDGQRWSVRGDQEHRGRQI